MTGILCVATALAVYSAAQYDYVTGDIPDQSRVILRSIGITLVLDGLYVKVLGFVRSNVFSFMDSVGAAIFDTSFGIFLTLI